jgi:hypothetical protein
MPPFTYAKPSPPRYRTPLPVATIVGESPNSTGVEKYETLSGKRLFAMMGVELPWWNIHGAQPPRWSARVARARAEDWLKMRPELDEPLILLGRKVCAAFGVVNEPWLEWYRRPAHGHPLVAFPHPSPRNPWWHVPGNLELATALLVSIAKKEVPHYDFKNKDD